LTATVIDLGGTYTLPAPAAVDDLFTYVTDGSGMLVAEDAEVPLGQYDVLMARPEMPTTTIRADEQPLHFLNFYLPRFLA
jgi:hypothetical protein